METLHLDEGGGTSERRTTPTAMATVSEVDIAMTKNERAPGGTTEFDQLSITGSQKETLSGKKKLERRKIRFNDDPNENSSGILGSKTNSSQRNMLGSGIQPDKPELYEF